MAATSLYSPDELSVTMRIVQGFIERLPDYLRDPAAYPSA
jgi:hypothetical protein